VITEWLKSLGIDSICQWDLLVFLESHRTLLVGAEDIARLMPYGAAPVVAALDQLESRGLLERSRLSQGARLYQLVQFDGPRDRAFKELLILAASRMGRLEIIQNLRKMSLSAVVLNVRVATAGGVRGRNNRDTEARGKEGVKWPKAI
jgi:hypothetical protein